MKMLLHGMECPNLRDCYSLSQGAPRLLILATSPSRNFDWRISSSPRTASESMIRINERVRLRPRTYWARSGASTSLI